LPNCKDNKYNKTKHNQKISFCHKCTTDEQEYANECIYKIKNVQKIHKTMINKDKEQSDRIKRKQKWDECRNKPYIP